jgi:cyclohexanecarboxylate-CoA ligase
MNGSESALGGWRDVRPSAEQSRRYRRLGLWRDETPTADLRRWARETPDAVAVTAYRAGSGVRRFTYREYQEQVESFAVALRRLGVTPGEVVAIQLPNWWQVDALVLACARSGAIVAPIGTPIRNRELELMLARLDAVVCVTVDQWQNFDHSAALAEMAPRLSALRHRAVLGERVNPDEIDLT